MIDQERDEFRQARFKAGEQALALVIEIGNRVVGLPKPRQPSPLRMGIKAIADGAAQLHPDPGSWMRIIEIEPEDKRPRQADDADEPRVDAMHTRATDQKSETISEIHRSHRRHTKGSRASPCLARRTSCSDGTNSNRAAP